MVFLNGLIAALRKYFKWLALPPKPPKAPAKDGFHSVVNYFILFINQHVIVLFYELSYNFIVVFWFLGGVMAGFVSVTGSVRGAGVIARPLSCGWVWARRALPGGVGWSPAPACLFVPFGSLALACAFARSVSALGWRVWLRSGSVGTPVWSACGLPIPAFAVKVALPGGMSVRAARAALPMTPSHSSLAVLGV